MVLALAAGCGGGEEGGGTQAAEEGVSKQEFIAEADAICAEANAKREELQSPQLTVAHPRAVAKYATRMRRVYNDALGKLKALEPPQADEEAVNVMLAKFEQAFALTDDVAAAGRKPNIPRMEQAWFKWSDLAIEGQNMAHKYGLKECARFGTG